ncbi:hypothetical protein LINPERPRIM_LOCUS24911 [Linum perenne]
MSQSSESSHAPPPPLPLRPPTDFGAFRRKKVDDFNGDRSTDPLVVERWLSKVTRSLQEMRATDEDRVLLTVSLLQEAAYDWWLTQPASQHEPPTITWANFVEDFKSNFIPESFRDAKQKEFLMIKQTWGSEGRETVAEYTARFDRLIPHGGPQFQDPVI